MRRKLIQNLFSQRKSRSRLLSKVYSNYISTKKKKSPQKNPQKKKKSTTQSVLFLVYITMFKEQIILISMKWCDSRASGYVYIRTQIEPAQACALSRDCPCSVSSPAVVLSHILLLSSVQCPRWSKKSSHQAARTEAACFCKRELRKTAFQERPVS